VGCPWSTAVRESDEMPLAPTKGGMRGRKRKPQKRAYAATPCRRPTDKEKAKSRKKASEQAKREGRKLKKGEGEIYGVLRLKHYDAYRETSLCVRALVDEHEQEHLDDEHLQGACNRKKYAGWKNKHVGDANQAWADAIDAGECRAYPKDLKCLQELLECCKKRGDAKEDGVFCCRCEDVEDAIYSIEQASKAHNCDGKGGVKR